MKKKIVAKSKQGGIKKIKIAWRSWVVAGVIILAGGFLGVNYFSKYNPNLDSANFTTSITNKFFNVKPGKELTYQATTPAGTEKVVITVDKVTKNIGGFDTLVYHDRVYKNDILVEDTTDYLAQEKSTGDVWYFGEEVDNYKDGVILDHHGTFLHGTDGAKAGIWLKSVQEVGDSYRQEYLKGTAEDMNDVIAVDQTVTTKKATYTGCVKLYAWTPLDKDSREYKYNCPEVGGEVLIEQLTEGKRTELVNIILP
jgi:hypothetical protein